MTAKLSGRPWWGEPRLVSICAWCPSVRERTEAAHRAGFEVTHGMCPTCATKFQEGA